MSHYIDEKCIGCTACINVCPTEAIAGERKVQHTIDPDLCIDCGACARVCPALSIADQFGDYKPRVAKRQDWPKPVVYEDLCTGCNFCVDICPWDCLELSGDGAMFGTAVLVKPMACVGCRECEEVCAKGAILVLDPHQVASPV